MCVCVCACVGNLVLATQIIDTRKETVNGTNNKKLFVVLFLHLQQIRLALVVKLDQIRNFKFGKVKYSGKNLFTFKIIIAFYLVFILLVWNTTCAPGKNACLIECERLLV